MSDRIRRRTAIAALALLGLSLSACGSATPERSAHPPGSPQNPNVADPIDAATAARAKKTGRLNETLPAGTVEATAAADQSLKPCALVSSTEAASILGVAVRKPLAAPQGPTCVYRPRSGAGFVTLALAPFDAGDFKSQIPKLQKVRIASRTGYCVRDAHSTLYVPLPGKRVLTVGTSCTVARAFAVKALGRLAS
jgi:hypothetical protein